MFEPSSASVHALATSHSFLLCSICASSCWTFSFLIFLNSFLTKIREVLNPNLAQPLRNLLFPHLQHFTTVCLAIHHLAVLIRFCGRTWVLKLHSWSPTFIFELLDFVTHLVQLRFCCPLCIVRHRMIFSPKKPTNCEHFSWTLPANVSHTTPLECRFCISDTWLLSTRWFRSTSERVQHHFTDHIAQSPCSVSMTLCSHGSCTTSSIHHDGSQHVQVQHRMLPLELVNLKTCAWFMMNSSSYRMLSSSLTLFTSAAAELFGYSDDTSLRACVLRRKSVIPRGPE